MSRVQRLPGPLHARRRVAAEHRIPIGVPGERRRLPSEPSPNTTIYHHSKPAPTGIRAVTATRTLLLAFYNQRIHSTGSGPSIGRSSSSVSTSRLNSSGSDASPRVVPYPPGPGVSPAGTAAERRDEFRIEYYHDRSVLAVLRRMRYCTAPDGQSGAGADETAAGHPDNPDSFRQPF